MLFRYPKGEPRFFGSGNSAQEELEALRELRPKIAQRDRNRLDQDIRVREAGLRGEERVRFELANSHLPLCIVQDLYLERDGLTAQIDFLVITPFLNIVIECKNLYGDITIGSDGSFVRNAWGKTEGMYSPAAQNERHLALMRQVLLDDLDGFKRLISDHYYSDYYRSLIVLANDETVLNAERAPKEVRNTVVRRDALVKRIRELDQAELRKGEFALSLDQMAERAEKWVERSSRRTVGISERYELTGASPLTQSNPASISAAVKPGEEPLCPRCGSAMLIRRAGKGARKGKQFWGCSRYPLCRGTINIE